MVPMVTVEQRSFRSVVLRGRVQRWEQHRQAQTSVERCKEVERRHPCSNEVEESEIWRAGRSHVLCMLTCEDGDDGGVRL